MKPKLPILMLACLCGCESKIHIKPKPVESSTNSYELARNSQQGYLSLVPQPTVVPVSFQTMSGEWLNVSSSDESSLRPGTAILKCKYRPIVTETSLGWRITFDTNK